MTETQQWAAAEDFESALFVEVTVEDQYVLRIAQRVDQTLVFQGLREARALALDYHWRVLMKMTQSHLHPLLKREVATSQGYECLNFVTAILHMVGIEIVAAVNQLPNQTRWVNRALIC